ncbi:hypothetical protein FXO38_18205 [Capsicum annuum]|nr:hypothetical protein FXO38_18205 [Capsicum annuum]KAF3677266.1 hypothetical protein FXO37_04917 [Capsicum annuum]
MCLSNGFISRKSCEVRMEEHVHDKPTGFEDYEVETYLANLCSEVLHFYIEIAPSGQMSESSLGAQLHWIIPLGSDRRRELVACASLIIATLQAICSLGDALLEKSLFGFFPLLSSLITYEHGSNEIQLALSDMLISSVGQRVTGVSEPNEAKVSQARKRQGDMQYAGMKAQFDALLASRDVSEEPSSDEDNEDYYVDNAPPYC